MPKYPPRKKTQGLKPKSIFDALTGIGSLNPQTFGSTVQGTTTSKVTRRVTRGPR